MNYPAKATLLFFVLLLMLFYNILQCLGNCIILDYRSYIFFRIPVIINILLIILNIILIFTHIKFQQEHQRSLLFSINVLLSLVTLAFTVAILLIGGF